MDAPGEAYFACYRRDGQHLHQAGLPTGLVVREACVEDLDGLAALCHERDGEPPNHHRERFQKDFRDHPVWINRLVLVAEIEGTMVGYGRANKFQPGHGSPANVAPAGWYLGGVVVTPKFRRRGIGSELTRQRLNWIAQRADEAFYFVNAQNLASIDLHTRYGFVEVTRDFSFPGTSFRGGSGLLFRARLSP